MHKLAAAVLAVPVIALLYLPVLFRRSIAARLGLALGVGAILGLGATGAMTPERTAARPPTVHVPVTRAAFTELLVGHAPDMPVTIAFSGRMDERSVAAALKVEPPTPVDVVWDKAGAILTVMPRDAWAPATLHTVTIEAGTLDANGVPLVAPARASFLVRPATTGQILATSSSGERVAVDTSFVVTFDRPIQLASAVAAFRITPEVPGSFELGGRRGAGTALTFRPDGPLAPDTAYSVTFVGRVIDTDGAALGDAPAVGVQTAKAPGVVRFRPLDRTTEVGRGVDVSVRFTQPMDRTATTPAFTVTVDGKTVTGKVVWAEGDKVLVLDPDTDFGYGKAITLAVSDAARSKDGALVAKAAKATFKTAPRPVVRPRATSKPTPIPGGGGGGGAVGAGTWAAVETYYLRLMNCTRTGGWVTSSGACSSPGGRNVAPLRLDPGISSRVARPYARYLATRGLCSHFIGGNPGNRLRRAGYSSYRWAENLGCRSGNAYTAVLGSHRFFQSERPYNGGHYRNLMNPAYDRAGIGVWLSGGRVRLVVDFYHP